MTYDQPPSMDLSLVRSLLVALTQTHVGKVGRFSIVATNPEGIQNVEVLAMDEVVWLRIVEPALLAAKIEISHLKKT